MVKKTKTKKEKSPYITEKRRDGRYMVRKRGGKLVNGPEKAEVLHGLGLIKLSKKKSE